KDFLVKKDFSSSLKKKSFMTMQYHPTKDDMKFPKTIFFKDSRVLYNTVSDEVKEVNDLDIFNEADSINKTLYLLMSSFIIEESKNKKLKFKDKNELKKMFINELKSEQAFMGELKTSDEQLMSKLESLVDRVFLKEIKNNSWGGGLFSAINEFLKKTKRSVTRDEKGFIAFKLNNGSIIKWYNFSRGEKTLLVLLLSVFLNKDKDVIFILDEPDLSLHIEWQELLLPNLSRLAPERQFILSTHSPALVGNIEEQYLNIAAITE
ncbi:ATP-binding protein, partial [Escherichia coli]|nr:ATP-binding protein [Escherichia coli]